MGLELVAARVLAPAMGNSIYVWGAVISSVMVALSLGYWIGGHAADRFGPSRVLPMSIAGAALGTVFVPPLATVTLPWAAELGPRLGSLVASACVFFVPSLLLATVSPLGVRLASADIEHVGRSAGGLYATSTAGSIVGTLATAFWLIPLLSLDSLIVWTGLSLTAAAILALVLAERVGSAAVPASSPLSKRTAARVSAGTLAAALAVGATVLVGTTPMNERNAYGETVLFRSDTQYHRITVTEDEEVRHLRFDRSHQSAVYVDDEYESAIRYPDYLHLSLAANPDAKRTLVLGLGGGTLVKRMWRDYDPMRIDAVEIDPEVIDVAYTYFALPEDPRITVAEEDARRYVQRTDRTYGIVVIDAYYADGLPFHLTTREFFEEVDAVLEPDGVVAYNVISAVEGEPSELFRSLYRTAGTVWEHLWAFPIGIGEDGDLERNRNIIVLATDADLSETELLQRIAGRVDGRVSIDGFDDMGDDLFRGIVGLADVPELTDEHAPTDSLIHVN
jgi:spermidine synthase